jgi:hypothetical protein
MAAGARADARRKENTMYRHPGLHTPIHGPLPTHEDPSQRRAADGNRQVPGVTQPFMFSRLFLVTGILLAAVAVASLVSG